MSQITSWPPAEINVSIKELPFGSLAQYVMRTDYMLIFVALYVGLVHYLQPPASKAGTSRIEAKRSGLKIEPKKDSGIFTMFIVAHNLLLAFYSMYTFYYSFSIYLNTLRTEGFSAAYCDSNYTSWNSGLFKLAYVFYLSKYYEVIDTAIILLKGRRSSTLQTYHHAGAIICMFLGVYYVPAAIFYFVVVNSFVHSIMYNYYALSALGFHPPGKKYLTSLQITQFLVGFIYAPYTIFKPNCSNDGQKFASAMNLAYLAPLTYLFVSFAIRTYGKKLTKKD